MPSLSWPLWDKQDTSKDALSWPWTEQQPNKNVSKEFSILRIRDRAIATTSELGTKFTSLPPHLMALCAFSLGSVTSLSALYVYKRLAKRIPNANWVTPDMLAKKRWVKGYVTSVGDADNFHIYHTPGFGWNGPLKLRHIPSERKDLKDLTIHIRIAGADAPEASHFGRPGQEFAEESMAWLKQQVEGKTVYCQMLEKDRFGRIVSFAHLRPRILPGFLATGRNVSLDMVRAGWAEVYEQTGAQYGHWGKAEFLRLQDEARAAYRGIWEYGVNRESAAEYKRRHRAADVAKNDSTTTSMPPRDVLKGTKSGRFRRILRWTLR